MQELLAPRWFKVASQRLYTASQRICSRSNWWYSGNKQDSKSGHPGFNSHNYTIRLTLNFFSLKSITVTFMGTSGVHKFHFTSDSANASHVAWEHLDYDHTAYAFPLDCAFTHHSKCPQVVELLLPRVTGCTEFYIPTRPSHLVGGALVRHHRSYSPTEIRSM